MSCCFGFTFFADKEAVKHNADVDDEAEIYVKNESIRPLLSKNSSVMSTGTEMRVPFIPTSTRDIQSKTPVRKPKELEKPNHHYRPGKELAPSPTSSAENFHFKASSSDSSTSKEEVSDVSIPDYVRLRSRPIEHIPATACYNFDAEHKDEVSITRGSKVIVRRKLSTEDEYVFVEVLDNGKKGLAPKKFFQPRGLTPPAIELGVSKAKLEAAGRKLGQGTYAVVYEVLYDKKRYALKVLRDENREKALQEAECLNGLDHKNIVKVFGICYKPVSILLELCAGGQLVELLKRPNFNPPVRVLLNWALQIAEALHYMHDREFPICHCDLKPQNVIILEKPCTCDSTNFHIEDSDICSFCGNQRLTRLTLKLTDFGLAKKPEIEGRYSLVGSTPYMSPEYVRTSQMNPKADIWSYGVLVWEIFTKETPYEDLKDTDLMAICFAIGQNKIKLDINKICSAEVKDLLLACWRDEASERPTMKEIIEMIGKIPTNNPEYVLIGGPEAKHQWESSKNVIETNQSVIEKLRIKLSKGIFQFDKPKPPPRKVTKSDISAPTDVQHCYSVTREEGGFAIVDHEEDRQRHKSSHDNGGTLPREAYRGNLRPGISTPELHNTGLGSTLERKPAMRRKIGSNKGTEQLVTSCLSNTQHKTSVNLGSTTPLHDSNPFQIDEKAIVVVEDPALIKVPRKSRSSQRSTSSSTFYVDPTSPSEISDISMDIAKKPKDKSIMTKFKNIVSKPKEPSSNMAVYDPKTHRYCKFNDLSPYSYSYACENPTNITLMAPSNHHQTVNLAQYIKPTSTDTPTPTSSHFQKFQNTPVKQRRQKIAEHRRNPSNTSERQYSVNNANKSITPTGQKSPSIFHHSSSEGASMSSSHLSVANYSPSSRSSAINFGTVLPLPATSPTAFSVNDETFSPRDHRSRAFTTANNLSTEIPEPSQPAPPPILHTRSRSTDVVNNQANNSQFLDKLAQFMSNQNMVENPAYAKTKPEGKQASVTPPAASEAQHYIALQTNVPKIPISHGKQKSADHAYATAPPLPPHNKDTEIEVPKTMAPKLPPRTFHPPSQQAPTSFSEGPVTSNPGYLTLESLSSGARSSTNSPSPNNLAINPHYVHTTSSPANLNELQSPSSSSEANTVPRPDTLPDRLRSIQRHNDYVRLSGQVPRLLPYLKNHR